MFGIKICGLCANARIGAICCSRKLSRIRCIGIGPICCRFGSLGRNSGLQFYQSCLEFVVYNRNELKVLQTHRNKYNHIDMNKLVNEGATYFYHLFV